MKGGPCDDFSRPLKQFDFPLRFTDAETGKTCNDPEEQAYPAGAKMLQERRPGGILYLVTKGKIILVLDS